MKPLVAYLCCFHYGKITVQAVVRLSLYRALSPWLMEIVSLQEVSTNAPGGILLSTSYVISLSDQSIKT